MHIITLADTFYTECPHTLTTAHSPYVEGKSVHIHSQQRTHLTWRERVPTYTHNSALTLRARREESAHIHSQHRTHLTCKERGECPHTLTTSHSPYVQGKSAHIHSQHRTHLTWKERVPTYTHNIALTLRGRKECPHTLTTSHSPYVQGERRVPTYTHNIALTLRRRREESVHIHSQQRTHLTCKERQKDTSNTGHIIISTDTGTRAWFRSACITHTICCCSNKCDFSSIKLNSWAVPSYQVARDKRSMCCTWFAHDCARATWAYGLETVRGAVRRL